MPDRLYIQVWDSGTVTGYTTAAWKMDTGPRSGAHLRMVIEVTGTDVNVVWRNGDGHA